MTKLTWGQFKAAVAEAGVKDTEEIWYIDVDCSGAIEITRHPKCGVSINDKGWG